MPRPPSAGTTAETTAIELEAHGGSIVEVKKEGGAWKVVDGSKYNRRITLNTEMEVGGPAAGHDRLKTSADATGKKVLGMINNCAGGWTPWGTILTGEENFHQYFGGDPAGTAEATNHKRYGLKGEPSYPWGKFVDRFDVTKEPNEPNRFGWIVEVNPYEPDQPPVKRTALGRFKHEGAQAVVGAGWARGRLHRRRRALRVCLQIRQQRHLRSRGGLCEFARCWTTACFTLRNSPTMAMSSGCRWCMAKAS